MVFHVSAGFTKCGTTAAASQLRRYEGIGNIIRKEPHFWDDFTNTGMTMNSYLQNFVVNRTSDKMKEVVFGDFTPRTVWHSDEFDLERNLLLSKRIHSVLPNAKLIVLVRDPVERLRSQYVYHIRKSKKVDIYLEPLKFHQLVVRGIEWFHNCTMLYTLRQCVYAHNFDKLAIARPDRLPTNYTANLTPSQLTRQLSGLKSERGNKARGVRKYSLWRTSAAYHLRVGLYHVHIREWFKHFPRKQFLIEKSEDNLKDPHRFEQNALDFLNVTDRSLREKKEKLKSNPSKFSLKMLDETRVLLENFYKPHNEELAKLLDDTRFLWT